MIIAKGTILWHPVRIAGGSIGFYHVILGGKHEAARDDMLTSGVVHPHWPIEIGPGRKATEPAEIMGRPYQFTLPQNGNRQILPTCFSHGDRP